MNWNGEFQFINCNVGYFIDFNKKKERGME